VSSVTQAPASRRVPTQARSKERVTRILDAAAHEFAELGFDAATTEGIAARAGTSVGSIYQFFPNKHALFEAIGRRYLDEVRALFESFTTEAAIVHPWYELLDFAIDAFATLDRESVGFRAVMLNLQMSRAFLEEGLALNEEMARRTEAIFAKQAPHLPKAKRFLVATVMIEALSGMLLYAARTPDRAKYTQVLAETKVLARRYVETYVGATATEAPAVASKTKPPARTTKARRSRRL
jgi:AcrR family transcriptional regulator